MDALMDSGQIQAWAAVVGVLLVIMGLVGGGIWWMSALFSRVGNIGAQVAETNGQLRKVRRTLSRHQHGSNVFRNNTNSALQNHEMRLASCEGKIESKYPYPPPMRPHPQLVLPDDDGDDGEPEGLPPAEPGV